MHKETHVKANILMLIIGMGVCLEVSVFVQFVKSD